MGETCKPVELDMPISTSSFEDDRDNQYSEYEKDDLYEQETMEFSALTVETAETLLKRLGGGVAEKFKTVEGIGWQADIQAISGGVEIVFNAHDELLDDLIRRFEEMADKATG